VRRAFQAVGVEISGHPIGATVSIGVASMLAPVEIDILLARADAALYRAKAEGRNRACLEQPTMLHVSAEEKGLLFGTSTFQDLE